MATQNGSTLSTIGTAWKGRASAPAPQLRRLTKQAAINFQTNGNGSTKVFNIPHGLDKWPAVHVLEYGHADSNAPHTDTYTATNIVVTFATAPQAGTNNVKFTGMAAY
jgi:hypothetical protein